MISIGMTLQTTGIAVLAVCSRPGLWYHGVAAALALVAIGFTFAVPALTKSVVGSVELADIGTASGLFSTVRQIGAAFGVAANVGSVPRDRRLHDCPYGRRRLPRSDGGGRCPGRARNGDQRTV